MSSVPPANSPKPDEQRSSSNAWPPGTPRPSVAAVKTATPATAGDTSRVAGPAAKTLPAAGGAAELPEVFGKYRIVRKLGQGGMAVVYLAQDTVLHRQVAIKVPLDEVQRDPELVKRFLREAQSAAGLTHPNICHVYDNGEIGGRHFIAMEFVDGKSLADAIRGIEVKARQAADLVRRIALTIAAAHDKGIIHRDLKPSNILLTKVSNRLEPKITDFGLAKRLDIQGSDLSKMGSFMGTPAYVSKEQALGEPPTPAMDIYSLGVVLYELLAGRLPFEGPDTVNVLAQVLMNQPAPPSTHRPGLCPTLEAICLKAVAKNPHERYASMADFAAALSGWLQGNAKSEKTDTGLLALRPKPASARFRGRRQPLGATLLGAAAFVALGIVLYIATNHGMIKIELSDPTAQVEVKVDGDRLDITGLAQPLSLRAGPHGLEVTGKDFESISQSFTVKRGNNPVVRVELVPKTTPPPPPSQQLVEKLLPSLVFIKVARDSRMAIGVVTDLGVCTVMPGTFQEVEITTLDGKRKFAGTVVTRDPYPFCWIESNELDVSPVPRASTGLSPTPQDSAFFMVHGQTWQAHTGKITASGTFTPSLEFGPRPGEVVASAPIFSWDGTCLGFVARQDRQKPIEIYELRRFAWQRTAAESAASSSAPSSEKYDPTINFKFFSKWNVTRGSVDISGNGFNDVLPGNDLYLDLDGTTGTAVRLESKAAFDLRPGADYELRFDLAGSQGDDGNNTVHVSLEDAFQEDFTLPGNAPFRTITRTIKVNQLTSAKLVFDHDGGDNAGLHLDNVKLTDTTNGTTLLHDDFYHVGKVAEVPLRTAPPSGQSARGPESSSPGPRAGSSPPPKTKPSTKRPTVMELKRLEADVRNARSSKSATAAASIRSRLIALINSQPESPDAIQAAALMRQVACPADGLQRNKIAASELAAAGGRDQVQVPAALVAVFGTSAQIARINSVEFSPDGRVLAAGSQDGTVRVWDLAGEGQQWSVSHGPGARWITFSPDGKLLLSGGGTVVKAWEAATGNEVRQFQSQKGEIQSLAFSPDGKLLAACDTERGVHLFDAATGQLRTRLEGQIDGLGQVAISLDGSMVAAGTFNHIMECWDTRSGKERRTTPSNAGWIHSVAFSPDGQVIAGASDDHQVRIWDRASLNQLKSLGQSNNVDCVAFSRDGKALAATASPDGKGTLTIWDWPSCQTRMTLSLGVPLFQFAMSLEGRYIAATSENGAVYVFRLAEVIPP
jgi:WD40 repeat protein/predicted Ser/Thr protein kinase